MLLRVFLFTLLCYQAVNAVKNRGSTTKNAAKDKYVTIEDEPQEMNIESIELDGKNPPMIYFWSTVRGVMNAFIHAWNAVDSDHSRPRETAQNIWYALEKTITHPIGSVSLMRISDHFADTMTHVTAEKTLDDLFTAIHLVVLRNNFDFMSAEYKLFTEGKAGKNIKEILKAIWDEWELLHSPKMTESLETIKKWITSVFPEELSEFVEQDETTLKRENSREESKLESPSFQRQDSGKKSKLRRTPTLERKNSSTNVNTKRELKRVKSKKGD